MRRNRLIVTAHVALICGVAAMSGACDGSSSPKLNSPDTLAISTAASQMDQVVLQPAVLSMIAGNSIGAGQTGAASPARIFAETRMLAGARSSATHISTARRLASEVPNDTRSLKPSAPRYYTYSGPAIPDSLRGYTFVLANGNYGLYWTIDSARTGAPANGVRFILMTYDTLGGGYNNAQAGYLDVTDQSANPRNQLAFTAHDMTGATVLDGVLTQSGAGTIENDTVNLTLSKPNGPSIAGHVAAKIDLTGYGRLELHMDATLSTGAMAVHLTDYEGELQSGDEYVLDTQLGEHDISFHQKVISNNGGYTYSDSTHILLDGRTYGNVILGYAGATWLYANGQEMTEADLNTFSDLVGAVNSALNGVDIGYDVLYNWIASIT